MATIPLNVTIGTDAVNVLDDVFRSSNAEGQVRLSAPAAGTAHVVPGPGATSATGFEIPAAGLEIDIPDGHRPAIWVVGSQASTMPVLAERCELVSKSSSVSGRRKPTRLASFNILIDADNGLINTGRDRNATVRADGAIVNNADRTFDIPDGTSGIAVDDFDGPITFEGSSAPVPDDEVKSAFIVAKWSALTGGTTPFSLWSMRDGFADNDVGLEIRSDKANAINPYPILGDGDSNTAGTIGVNPDIDTDELALVAVDYFFFLFNVIRVTVFGPQTGSENPTLTTAFVTSSDEATLAERSMVFFAGCDSSSGQAEAVNGVDGTTTFTGVACGYDVGAIPDLDEWQQIARFYGVDA